MDKYVELEAVKAEVRKRLNNPAIIGWMIRIVDAVPAADVAPVVHGRWEEYDRFVCNSDGEPVAKIGVTFVCSECGREADLKEPYCHCGARMDGDGK